MTPKPGPLPPTTIRLFARPPVAAPSPRETFLSDPFRLLFAVGWVASILGLLLWPLFFAGWILPPGRAHAFIMIQAFFGAFAAGFLWTAFPRMVEVKAPPPWLVVAAAATVVGNIVFHGMGFHLIAHILFISLLGMMIGFAALRFPSRKDLPPPSFVLVALGLATGLAGTILVALGESGAAIGAGYRFGRILLNETFILLLVMGVAAFLAPRFIGQAPVWSVPESRRPTAPWKKAASLCLVAGILLLAGTAMEAAGAPRSGAALAAIAVTGFILYHVRLWKKPAHGWLGLGIRVALLCAIAAPWWRLVAPEPRLAGAHLLLMGGFGLLTLVVGMRVTLGHSGYGHLFRARLPSVGAVVVLYLLAVAARLGAEFAPLWWQFLLTVSAISVIAAHGVWGWVALPKLLRPAAAPVRPAPTPVRIIPGASCCGRC